jgi:hypothetical protein
VLSPAIGLFVTVIGAMRQHRHQLHASVQALRPHDFVVHRLAHSSLAPARVHRIPHPTFVTIAKRPFSGAGWAGLVEMICPSPQANGLRHIGTTGKSVAALKIVSREEQLLFFVIPGCAEGADPESISPDIRAAAWILRCAIAHHSSARSLSSGRASRGPVGAAPE